LQIRITDYCKSYSEYNTITQILQLDLKMFVTLVVFSIFCEIPIHIVFKPIMKCLIVTIVLSCQSNLITQKTWNENEKLKSLPVDTCQTCFCWNGKIYFKDLKKAKDVSVYQLLIQCYNLLTAHMKSLIENQL